MSLCPVSVTRPLAGLTGRLLNEKVKITRPQNQSSTKYIIYKPLSLSDVEEGGARGQARLSVQEMRLDNVQTIPPCVSPHLTSLQDSLTGEEFNFSPGQGLAMVNKNNYTLTYSGHGSISSHQEHSELPYISSYPCNFLYSTSSGKKNDLEFFLQKP